MKKLSITILAALTLFACKQETTYTVTGTVEQIELEGKQVLLGKNIDGAMTWTDTAVITDGAFTFTGSVERPTIGRLLFNSEDRPNSFSVNVLIENAKISVAVDAEKISKVSGTKNNNILQTFVDVERIPMQKMSALVQEANLIHQAGGDTARMRVLGEEYQALSTEREELLVTFVTSNINNFAGQSRLDGLANLPVEKLKEVLANANVRTLQVPEVARVVKRVEAIERTAVGQPFVDLRMSDPDGNEIALSDFVGKGYVMIDFTATWCGPCRVGKPAMIATYNKYKDKGFNIVGVWFDNSHDAWINGMKALNLPDWPQMSDLKGWQSEGQIQYVTSGIPHSVLIDPNGIIIARGLRGDDLANKLAELLD